MFWNGLFRDCLQHSNIESYSLCCLWVNIKLLLINAARAVTKETGNTGQGYIFLKAVYCNHFRQTVDIFLLSLCVIHRHVARATKKGGGTRMCSCHLQLYIMYYTKNQPLQDYTTVSYAPTTMIAHTAKH